MTLPEPDITINVDVTNPGQVFACCGLLELADRLWPGAEACFEGDRFRVSCGGDLPELLRQISAVTMEQLEPKNDTASPLRLAAPFDMGLDWWTGELGDVKALKVWAGSMRCYRIAQAMQKAIANAPDPLRILDYACVVRDPDNPRKKVEPYYFDSRRGGNARSLDIGFAPDSLTMASEAYPAVELLCLVGLQRFRPATTDRRRVFIYYLWSEPLPVEIASAAVSGAARISHVRAYRFENAFRTDQRKHKSFCPATAMGDLT
jgi:CRISPR-associated protein Csb3